MKKHKLLLTSLSIAVFITTSMTFVQCKSTKTATRTSKDKSGNPNAFDASINENSNDMLEKARLYFASKRLVMKFSGQTSCSFKRQLQMQSMAASVKD